MKQELTPLIRQVQTLIGDEQLIDVYAVVKAIQPEFPEVAQETLVRIVSEEVVKAHCDAIWDRRN